MPIVSDIYYHVYEGCEVGQKPPVILIHGAGGTHLYWPSEVRRLPGYRIYAVDLPGHGKSLGRGRQSIPAYTEAILQWLEAVGLHSAIFVGHSMGSAIALNLAVEHRQHVLGLGLVASSARLKVSPDLLESTSSPTTYHNAINKIISWSFAKDTPERLTQLARKRMADVRPSVLHGDFLACDAFDASERLAEVCLPTLLVCGEEDKMTPLRYSQFMADRITDARLVSIPGAGHMVMLERPQAVAAAMVNFLEGISY
ncbi:alpha/beta fold hydrolase [Chloroflexota bacterium]